jgi:pimeloyl-ACP methyl ester carboxylesterase
MQGWSSDDVQSNGIRLHYYRTGGDKPPLVMAHGITDSGLCWSPVARVLEADYDLIMVDARGHGKSEVPATGYTNADHAADYAGLIRELGLQRPALLGHSMGAATVAYLAAQHPDLAGCILLEDPPWSAKESAPSPQEQQARADAWRQDVIARQRLSRVEILDQVRQQQPRWSEDEFEPWVEAKLQVSPNVLNYVGAPSIHWSDYVGAIRCPALLITGDTELGGIVSPQVAAAVVALNPNFQVAHLAGAGHSVRREQFRRYVEAVQRFLHKVYR